ncbi:MAG: tetratricopeptide repeat protein [Epsilonproteobacteria bacterium]|nr:tetratricopeptide repeat protein [Campylobacterota bacterium]
MDFLFEYRDPLFGLVLFFGLIFVIAFLSYWWALFRIRSEDSRLERFFQRFEPVKDKDIDSLLQDHQATLLLLADALSDRGEYEKAIAIYLKLKEGADLRQKLQILQKLGDLYAKAGFMARAIESYEEILRYVPRRPKILRKLLLIFEKMGDWERIEEIVQILEELEAFEQERKYFAIKRAVAVENIQKIKTLKKEFPRIALEYLFARRVDLAWELLEDEDVPRVLDILWRLPKDQIRYHTPILQEIYTAKGYINMASSSDIFEIDLLLHYPKGDLDFEYLCVECKNIFPFPFHRCAKCASIKEPIVERIIIKKRGVDEESLSI